MVRWSSGALNNYVGTTTGGLGSEQPIHGPDKDWTHSVIMTAGQYTGDGLSNDLIIRWALFSPQPPHDGWLPPAFGTVSYTTVVAGLPSASPRSA